MTVDTACSSSAVALHLALQGLPQAATTLVGGVTTILSPALSRAYGAAGMLAPDGQCKAFDRRADGYGRAEGCAAAVLQAIPAWLEGDCPAMAVVRGSAINNVCLCSSCLKLLYR